MSRFLAFILIVVTVLSALVLSPRAERPWAYEPLTRYYITPSGSGNQSASSWADAAKLPAISDIVLVAPPGAEIWIRADMGDYQQNKSINITRGGTGSKPITIKGVDANGNGGIRPVIKGNRTDPFSPTGTIGNTLFILKSGINGLRFMNLTCKSIGNGCFKLGGITSNVRIQNMDAYNVQRFIENGIAAGETDATTTKFTVRNVNVFGYSKGVARMQYNSNDILFVDVFGDSQRQDEPGGFPVGIQLGGGDNGSSSVHNVTHQNVTMLNSQDDQGPDGYWNGDGFATEEGEYDITYIDTYAAGHTDSGYDIKSTSTTLTRAVAEDNKRNFRFHYGDKYVYDCIARNPNHRGGTGTQAQIHASWHNIAGGNPIQLNNCTLEDDSVSTQVLDLDGLAKVYMFGGLINYNLNAQLSVLETGSELVMDGVTVN